MNCLEFEKISGELARAPDAGDAAREQRLSHAASCARCAARLAGEQALTAGLRALALSDREMETPPRVETVLRQAFRARAANVTPCAAPLSRRAGSRTMPAVWAIAAGLAFVAVGISIASLWRQTPAPQQAAQAPAINQEANLNQEANYGRAATPVEQATSAGERTQAESAPVARAGHRQSVAASLAARPRSRVRQRDRAPQPRAPVAGAASSGEVAQNAVEVATEYLPLTPGGAASSADGGQIVRVELPRSALTLFGLPVSAERAHERVRADVVLGHDGVARAIRFIR